MQIIKKLMVRLKIGFFGFIFHLSSEKEKKKKQTLQLYITDNLLIQFAASIQKIMQISEHISISGDRTSIGYLRLDGPYSIQGCCVGAERQGCIAHYSTNNDKMDPIRVLLLPNY